MSVPDYGGKIVIVGSTGLVGTALVRTIERLDLPFSSIKLLASERSEGRKIPFRGGELTVETFSPEHFDDARWVFFSGKDGLSEEYCPVAAQKGAWVIDNSAAFRMNPDVPLVVPEVNLQAVTDESGIIANPNCSTIQLAVALEPIRRNFGLKKVIVSTYQAVSGAGSDYLETLQRDSMSILDGHEDTVHFSSPAFNCLPAVGSVSDNGRYSEESKLENELRKILGMPKLKVVATAVRVPAYNGHGESVVVETEKKITPEDARRIWLDFYGIRVMDDISRNEFPTPRSISGTDPVWIGRIRSAGIFKNDIAFWAVADNLLKGAALNAVQIALGIHKRQNAAR